MKYLLQHLRNYRLGIILSLCMLMETCQKIESDEFATDTKQVVNIKARTAENEHIQYPLYLYAFDEKGACAASQTLTEAGETPSLSLKNGKYRIVALSGISGGYVLPEIPEAQNMITMGANGASSALMLGKADVTIGNKQTTLNIVLRYAVSAITTHLTGIPSDVSDVKLMISPLCDALYMNGEYSSKNMQLEIPCKKSTEDTWCSDTIYAFPGCGNETLFNIQLTGDNNTQSTYAYTYSGIPEANRAFNINGNYTGAISIGGEFIISGWDTSIDVSFEFGTTLADKKEDENQSSNDNKTGLEVGSIWNDAIVVKTEGREALLMSLEEWFADVSDTEYILQEQSGWQLPTYEEAVWLRSTFGGENRYMLNEKIWTHNGTLTGIDGVERYLCNKNGEFYSFIFAEGTTISKAGSKKLYYIRLFKRISF